MNSLKGDVLMRNSSYTKIPSSEITPEWMYRSRREFMKLAGFTTGAALLAACAPKTATSVSATSTPIPDTLNSLTDITHYNNYYEFTVSKTGVADLSKNFKTSPWQVEVSGLCDQPTTFSIEQLNSQFTPEERVYRMRCVEDWSMVIPWQGFRLSKVLNAVKPQNGAKFIRFTGILDPADMPGQQSSFYPWPYTEGLRMDEAMHDLTIMATGLYGKPLEPQCGAPIRLVVPWKYGYKSIKAVVKIELIADQPTTFWNTLNPATYGFYSNVDPRYEPTEQRLGETSRRPTLMYNGYGDQVASLYEGMNLQVNS
jgi:sulfoxide reductase catalytic subunit YedY